MQFVISDAAGNMRAEPNQFPKNPNNNRDAESPLTGISFCISTGQFTVMSKNGDKSNDYECSGEVLEKTWSVQEAAGKHTVDVHFCDGAMNGISIWSAVRDDYLFKIPTKNCPMEISRRIKTTDGDYLVGFRGDLKDI